MQTKNNNRSGEEYRQYLELMGLMETQTGQNTMWKRIKSILRGILPVGRTYVDKKFDELKKQELSRQKNVLKEMEGHIAKKSEYLENKIKLSQSTGL